MSYYPGYRGRRKPSIRDRNIRAGLVIGIAGAAWVYFRNQAVGVSNERPYYLKDMSLTYQPTGVAASPETQDLMRNPTITGTKQDITLDALPGGQHAQVYVRILYDTYREGQLLRQRERIYTGYVGSVMSHTFSPNDYDANTLAADEVRFTVTVLPPETGGSPAKGEHYPSYSFTYKVGA